MFKNATDIVPRLKGVRLKGQTEDITLEKFIELHNSDEEHELEIGKVTMRTEAQETELMTNFANEKKAQYDDGKEKGLKDAINSSLETFGLDMEGKAKNLENFATLYKAKVLKDANIQPDKKVSELEEVVDKLRSNLEKKDGEITTLKSENEKTANGFKISSAISDGIPSDLKFSIPMADVKQLISSKQKFGVVEGFVRPLDAEGNVMKDKETLKPLEVKDVMPNLYKPYLKANEGGAGGDDEPGGGGAKAGTYEAFVIEMNEKGVNEGSSAFDAEVDARIEKGTLKM